MQRQCRAPHTYMQRAQCALHVLGCVPQPAALAGCVLLLLLHGKPVLDVVKLLNGAPLWGHGEDAQRHGEDAQRV